MGLLHRIRGRAAMASGDFDHLFRKVEVPPLPAATVRLLKEINLPEPDPQRLARVIGGTPELAAKVLQLVNSSFFALRRPVSTIQHAVSLVGPGQIRPLALGFTMASAVPRPASGPFDHEAFWTDSLHRALLARAFAREGGAGDADEAFTAMLLADLAVPVLLRAWAEPYAPVVDEWKGSGERLSALERRVLGWSHAEAGAWILGRWKLPAPLIDLAGAHVLPPDSLRETGIVEASPLAVALAALAPSVLRPDAARVGRMVEEVKTHLGLGAEAFLCRARTVAGELEEIRGLFRLRDRGAAGLLTENAAFGVATP